MDTTEFEDKMRKIESLLEEAGQMICSIPGSSESWFHINGAIDEVQDAIHSAWKMRKE